jgi:hypothetical protein
MRGGWSVPEHRTADGVVTSLTLGRRILRRLHDTHERLFPARALGIAWDPVATGAAANELIHERLASGAPTMIARIGASEMMAMLQHLAVASSSPIRTRLQYIRGLTPPPWWDAAALDAIRFFSGFYPATPETVARFTALMMADLPCVDLLGSWLPGERFLASRCRLEAARVPLADLEPYFHERPWSRVLRDRTVLVVHPFADLIKQQFAKREALFPGRDVLPPFELRTLRAVQSVAGATPEFPDWFAALDAMTARIERESFDVAIIGAGAYGLPLAARIKRMGRQAIHLGGATQLLFGIRGKRWDDWPQFQHLFNDAWVHPGHEERPPLWRELEGGAYW